MGGKDNSDLIDELIFENHVVSQKVERVLRLVDRGIFVHPHGSRIAYRDAPFRSHNLQPGQIHISAPSIYCNVLEMLDLHKNQSFLNVGSGSGYLSTVAGFLIGENGVSHGIELHSNIIEHARESIHLFASQKYIAGFDWCRPQFVHGNAFVLKGISRRYDRIYVGAQIEQADLPHFSEMLKEDGVMIVPVKIETETRFQQVKRTAEGIETIDFMHVAFAELVPPSETDGVEMSSSSRKRKLVEKPTNPNELVTEELLSCFKPNTLAVITSFAVRKMIADPLRISLPIAIVQKVKNKQRNSEVMASIIRRHERTAARRLALANDPFFWGNENPNRMMPLHIVPEILEFADLADPPNEPLNEPLGGVQLPNNIHRMDEDEAHDVQALEERMEAAFNNEMRAAATLDGPHVDIEEEEMPVILNEQLLNIMRREAETRMLWEQQHLDDATLNNHPRDPDEGGRIREQAREYGVLVQHINEIGQQLARAGPREFALEEFRPFQIRLGIPGDASTDEDSITEEQTLRHCLNCHRPMCKCKATTLKHAAISAMNAHRNKRLFRMAKDQAWVKRITLLTRSYRRPRSFADQLPSIFEENISSPHSKKNKTIEDWYLQRNKERFMDEIDMLEKIVRKVGILQFKQETNDYFESTALADSKKLIKMTYRNEVASISRFEKKIAEVVDQLPLSQNVKLALKWNLYRDS